MARRSLSEVPEDLIQYLQEGVFPKTGGLLKYPDGSWESREDAAARRGRQEVINYLIMLRELQVRPETDEDRLATSVEVDDSGRMVFTEDSHVLRPTR